MDKKKVFLTSLISTLLILAYLVFAAVSNITLNSPANASWSSTSTVEFNCTAYTNTAGANISNVSLYTNVQGSFGINMTYNDGTNLNGTMINFTVTNIADNNTGYLWGCKAWEINSTTGAYLSNNVSINNTLYVDTVLPAFTSLSLNATDGTNTITETSATKNFNGTGYLKNDTAITIRVTITDLNLDTVILYYNTTNGLADTNAANSTTMNNITAGTTRVYNATIPAGDIKTDGLNISFIIWANDSANNVKQYNNSNKGFNITIDGKKPTVSLTEPTVKTVDVLRSIKYTCKGGDGSGSGIEKCELTVTKPNKDTYTKNTKCVEIELKNEDTNLAGTYKVTCKVTDKVGWTKTSSEAEFIALYPTSIPAAKKVEEKEEVPEEKPEEEVTPPEEKPKQVTPGPTEVPKPSTKTGLLIAITIVIIGIVVYFVAFHKKK